MPHIRNRKRAIQVKFFVDEKEQALIKKKMELAGIENMSVYIRKMVIDGCDFSPFQVSESCCTWHNYRYIVYIYIIKLFLYASPCF